MIARRLTDIKSGLPEGVTLVAVSKFHPVEALREAYDAGQRVFGESRAQELRDKAASLPADIRWHFIGHLQRNKVAIVVEAASMIESVDSEAILMAIDREAVRRGRRIDVLLEVHVAAEATKTGLLPSEAVALAAKAAGALEAVRLRGVMGMASFTPDDPDRIRADFDRIAETFNAIKSGPMAGNPDFDTISMGMSDDYEAAISAGSTMVRIGSAIFGPREY